MKPYLADSFHNYFKVIVIVLANLVKILLVGIISGIMGHWMISKRISRKNNR